MAVKYLIHKLLIWPSLLLEHFKICMKTCSALVFSNQGEGVQESLYTILTSSVSGFPRTAECSGQYLLTVHYDTLECWSTAGAYRFFWKCFKMKHLKDVPHFSRVIFEFRLQLYTPVPSLFGEFQRHLEHFKQHVRQEPVKACPYCGMFWPGLHKHALHMCSKSRSMLVRPFQVYLSHWTYWDTKVSRAEEEERTLEKPH